MKILTLNFLQCAVKACKSSNNSFPLHPKDCELVNETIASNPKLLVNILPRIDWQALGIVATETFFPANRISNIGGSKEVKSPTLGFPMKLPDQPPTPSELEADTKMQQDLHMLLIETQISEGALICGNCGHEYKIREGIANFLLPSHLV